ncbi:hypothetical protein MED121_04438 [Marinomonas sp. MED121]|uniref:GNAT family N-acetyltransferase n=1 Tax=Marinomonas sp. MED121 TaxID=314277 RepID=UPI00006901EF|nr:GNAT family N-acetyltransferase [Marinomonas sp. MED121]EAQ64337.1 hypothetical protein MED121_04438 [Marinomonas sp. MED121]
MITIERLNESHLEDVRQVSLADEQVKFAGTAEEFLEDGSDFIHLHVIKHDGVLVGFFKIDTAYSDSYTFCQQNALGLRAFVIDVNQQGKGIGTGAVKALFTYLKQRYSGFDLIYLTVNCKNPGAKMCYLKGGFEDTGEQYLGGEAGPQYIMVGKLNQ